VSSEWCLNKFVVPARSPTRHLDPPRPCPLSLQAPGPAWTPYKALSATRGCPGLSPVAKVGDLADTRKQIRHDAFVDKLTKLVHFVACKEEVSAKEFAELYVDHVFRLHGLSREFITDRDSRFTSAFWQEVTVLLGTRTVMSSSFHPQIDGLTERVNQTLETYLRHFVSVGLNDWDTLLSRAEFAHNAAITKTIRAAPFELTYGYRPRTPVGEVVEVVHPASAAFVERLQSSLSLARKLLIAAGLNRDRKLLQISVV
jgi:transposase InsO family protein